LFGTMTIGEQGKNGVRTYIQEQNQQILDVFFSHGHTELDTARMYAEGTTEPTLVKLDLKGATLNTKIYPVNPGDHSPKNLRSTFTTSLKLLSPYKVRVLYLHAPDRSVPFEDTLREANELYNEGLFETLGLSNFAAWEVAEVVSICKANGWVQPKIYQAMYNAIARAIESELVPCCRKFGLRIVIYNPLAGGFFAGKIKTTEDEPPSGGRFDQKSPMGRMYTARYLKDDYFSALNLLQAVADNHNIRLTSVALRWCQHHSVLGPSDGIIIGASSLQQVEQNCEDSEEGPLPENVLAALDEAWKVVGVSAPSYWR